MWQIKALPPLREAFRSLILILLCLAPYLLLQLYGYVATTLPLAQESREVVSAPPNQIIPKSIPPAKAPKMTVAKPKPKVVPSIVKEQVRAAVDRSGEPSDVKELVFLLIGCESDYSKTAVHDGGLGVGVAGFHRTTFDMWKKESGLDITYDTDGQVALMLWAFKDEWRRKHWSTYNRYMQTGNCRPRSYKG